MAVDADSFATPDDFGDIHASELHSTLGESLTAQAGDAFMGGFNTLGHGVEYLAARNGWDSMLRGFASQQTDIDPDAPDVPIADAQQRVKQEGLDGYLKLPQQDSIPGPVFDLMLNDARDRAQYDAAVNRGPKGFLPGALGFATQIGAGMIDPVNMAAFSIPVLGEARMGKLLASAGESVLGRTAVRTGIGAAQGAVGGAALVPADWWLHTQDGQDYTMADTLRSVALSAGMGGVAHGLFGGVHDLYSRITGHPLEGAPPIAGTHLPEAALAPGGVPADLEGVPGITELPTASENVSGADVLANQDQQIIPPHPAQVLADLPPGAREDVTRAAIADVISGQPVRAGEMLNEAAKEDPRIAESLDLYHGSPHDFDRFDLAHVGTGEGATSFGHGLYFAENKATAESYMRPAHSDYLSPYTDDLVRKPDLTLYRVRVDANPEHFIDWDKPLGDQSEHVRRALEGLPTEAMATEQAAMNWQHLHPTEEWAAMRPELKRQYVEEFLQENPDFRADLNSTHVGLMLNQLARRFGGEDSAGFSPEENAHISATLRDRGIPGVKYLDQGSRDAGEGTRNYVVFDDKLVRITHKNGKDVGLNEIKAAAAPASAASEGAPKIGEGAPAAGEAPHAAGEGASDDGAARLPGAPETPPAAAEPQGKLRKPGGRGPRSREPQTWSLLEFLASRGGIDPNDPLIADVRGSIGANNKFVPGFGHLIRRGGQGLDRLREAAVEAGYLHDAGERSGGESKSTLNDLLEAVDRELRGQRVYRHDRIPDHALRAEAERQREQAHAQAEIDMAHALHEIGADPAKLPDSIKDRVLEIMTREGESPINAIERAFMEADRAETEAGHIEPDADKIPGWDDDDDGGSASGEGGGGPGEQEPPGGGDRGGSRAGGTADRPSERLAQRADWRGLAERDPTVDQDFADASRDADRTPSPPDTPAKAISAAAAEAARADKLLEDILPTLSEDERRTFENALADLENDRTAREQIVRDGAACLAAASAGAAA